MMVIKNSAPSCPAVRQTGGNVAKAYNFALSGDNGLEINMYGEVVESVPIDWWTGKPVEGMYICEKEFLAELDKYKEQDKITVRINSVGGDLYAGLAIANRMKELNAEITTIADALCASAAVAIYQAGSTRKVFNGSQIMIHEPSCYIYGRYDVQGIKKVEKQLEAGKKSLIATYKERTGRTEDELEKMITGDCWMTGQEAIDEGFADELIEGNVSAEISEDGKTVISNGIRFPAEAFFTLPRNLKKIERPAVSCQTMQGIQNDNSKGGKATMTKQELMETYPEIYNEIVREAQTANREAVSNAVKEERERIREIDEIANSVGDEKMVKEAMFGDKPMNASELALFALKKQGQQGAGFLSGMKADVAASNVENVTSAPNAGTKSQEEQEMQDIIDGAALIIGKMEGDAK